jgi:hypothetical protein
MFGFIVGIIGNIVASYLYDILKGQDSKSPPLVLIIEPNRLPSKRMQESSSSFDQRAVNRELASRAIALLLFFIITFYFLWCAIYFPISLGPTLFNDKLNLGDVKILGWFTKASVSMSSVNTFIIVATMFLYLPLLLFGDKLLVTVQKWYDIFWPVTFESWILLRDGTSLFLALLVAGVVTFIVTDLPLGWAIAAPFIIVFFAILFAGASSESQR